LLATLVAAQGSDSLIRQLVAEVSQDSVEGTIRCLQDFGTREAKTDSNKAAVQYVLRRMTDFGCDTAYLQPFDTLYGFGPNVVGMKRGRLFPDIQFVLLGHIDCIADPPDSAPGANDNASGVAALLEACRVLGGEWFNYTIIFITQNAEEYTSGASYYAMWARQRGDSILGVLNLDMVGYALDGQDSVIALGKMVDPDCSVLLNGFCFSTQEYTALKVRRVAASIDTLYGYDHIYFWMFDYPALTVTATVTDPCHHTRGDTIGPYHYEQCGVNDLPMCTEVAKAVVATMAVLAQVEGRPAVAEQQPGVAQGGGTPSVVRGLFMLHGDRTQNTRAELTNVEGRSVLVPHPGPNDVSKLTPGVYFIRERSAVGGERPAVHKVVLTR